MGSMQIVQLEFQATELEYYKLNSVQVKEDFNSLFTVVQDVLKHSTSVAEKCLLGKNETITMEFNKSVPRVNCGLNILKQIYCTVACEADSKVDVSTSIVGILSSYSGVERAVLTLAAFALSYGELLYYIDRQGQKLNSFAVLISHLRRVDELIMVQQEDQFKIAISDLNCLTNLTLELVSIILELDNLSKKDYIDDLSVVTAITGDVERYSSYAIQVVVACMTQVNYLTYDRISTTKVLSSFASNLKVELTNLKVTVERYKSIIAEWEAFRKLHSCFCNRGGIVEAFTCFMYPEIPELDCHIEKPVRVDQVLKGKNVLLFISETEISEDDFLTLQIIHERLEEKQDYKIVWIPVVEEWTPKSIQDFGKWRNKMPWYVACYNKRIVGINYIKKRWQFSYKPMVVVLNSQGAIECLDALQMIRAWGIDAFPFRQGGPDHCIRPIISTITQQIEEEQYIFLYGGKQEWINDFGVKVTELSTRFSSKVSITSFAIGVENSKMEMSQFLTRMESLLYVRMKWNLAGNATKHIQDFLGFQNQKDIEGWALLCKGSAILACASGTYIKEAVTNYEKWTEYLGSKKFEICLQDYLDALIKQTPGSRPCRHVAIQSVSGWLPVDVVCPDCKQRMERVVTYKCCHNNAQENGSI